MIEHLPEPYQVGEKLVPSQARPFKARGFELVTRAVCHDCNTGWMSDLETKAAPLLTPMLRGKVVNLSLEQQATVALWAAKFVLMFQQTKPPEYQSIVAAHYRWVYKHKAPPPSTVVRLGCYTGDQRPPYYDEYSLELGVPDPRRPNAPLEEPSLVVGYRSVLLFGALIMEVTGTNLAEPVENIWLGETSLAMLPVWPIERRVLEWPSLYAFDDPVIGQFVSPPGYRLRRRLWRNGRLHIHAEKQSG